jgi:hypothetical protein
MGTHIAMFYGLWQQVKDELQPLSERDPQEVLIRSKTARGSIPPTDCRSG